MIYLCAMNEGEMLYYLSVQGIYLELNTFLENMFLNNVKTGVQ